MIDRLFLDIDGVLADFVSPAMEAHGKPFDVDTYPSGMWAIEDVLGVTPDAFWSKFDGYNFWRGLKVYDGAKAFVEELELTFGSKNICLLTSPSKHHDCIRGKKDWIDEHFPQFKKQVLFGSAKYFCANPSAMLIDDNDNNCDLFEAAGGKAVRVPRPWNKLGHKNDAYWRVIYVAVNLRRAAA